MWWRACVPSPVPLGPILPAPGPHANLTGVDLDGGGRSLVVSHEDQLFVRLEARSRSASGHCDHRQRQGRPGLRWVRPGES